MFMDASVGTNKDIAEFKMKTESGTRMEAGMRRGKKCWSEICTSGWQVEAPELSARDEFVHATMT